jgi:uncharacterized protein (DUF2267 family)
VGHDQEGPHEGDAEEDRHLARVVREVEVVARAEKQTISKAVAEALQQLSKAHADLEALEKLATSESA